MRNGVLISESSPRDLLVKQNASSLEEAFLSLCSSQQFDEVKYYNFNDFILLNYLKHFFPI